MKSMFCDKECGFEFKAPIEHCPRCGRFVGNFIRRMLSHDKLEQQKADYRNGVRSQESRFHNGPSGYGMKGW